jgi:hypothetical protein
MKIFVHDSIGTENLEELWNRPLVQICTLALVIRYSLMWFNHPWDISTFYNTFVNLSNNTSPYDEFLRLTALHQASIQESAPWYQYFAYPPGAMYIYMPLAKLWGVIHPGPETTQYLSPGTHYYPAEGARGFSFLFLYKTPIFLADLGIGVLLYKLTGRVRAASMYLLNPLVVLVSAMWMFDSIALLFLIAAIYCVTIDRPVFVGVFLAFGTLVKIFPAFAAPAIVVYYINRSDHDWVKVFLSYFTTIGVLIIPFMPEFASVMSFHGNRWGGGLTIHSLQLLLAAFTDYSRIWLLFGLSPAIGSITLITGVALATIYVFQHDLMLYSAVCVAIAAFLLSTKLVNEQYGMWMIPLLILCMDVEDTDSMRNILICITLLPILLAIIRVPILAFLYPIGIPPELTAALIVPKITYTLQALLAAAFVIAMLFLIKHYSITYAKYQYNNFPKNE